MQLHPQVAAFTELCRQHRRTLHRIPELGLEEYQTQAYLLGVLHALQPDCLQTLPPTGVKAVFYAKNPVGTIAFRADMDGIRLVEETGAPYASTRPGFMHACGHDGHMTVLLLLAKLISDDRDALRSNIVLLFQPGEEGFAGAKLMIDQGALENPHVDRIYGLHLWPTVPYGKIGVRWGHMMANSCEFDILVHGKSAHGASPQMGVDAVVAAAELITLLQTIITRSLDPHQDALLTIGKITGGTARNVIADRVELNGTLRSFSAQNYDTIVQKVRSMSDGLATATGAKFEFDSLMSYPCLENPRPMVEDFYRYISMHDVELVEPVMAAEDFAYYQQRLPGLFLFLGTLDDENKQPLHNACFDFQEDVLLYGVEVFRRLALDEPVSES